MKSVGIFYMNAMSKNDLILEDDRIPNGEKKRTRIPMKAKS